MWRIRRDQGGKKGLKGQEKLERSFSVSYVREYERSSKDLAQELDQPRNHSFGRGTGWKAHKDWNEYQWKIVLWTDKSKSERFGSHRGRDVRRWRKILHKLLGSLKLEKYRVVPCTLDDLLFLFYLNFQLIFCPHGCTPVIWLNCVLNESHTLFQH